MRSSPQCALKNIEERAFSAFFIGGSMPSVNVAWGAVNLPTYSHIAEGDVSTASGAEVSYLTWFSQFNLQSVLK